MLATYERILSGLLHISWSLCPLGTGYYGSLLIEAFSGVL